MSNAPDDCFQPNCCWDISKKVPTKIEGNPTSLVLFIIIPMFVGITICIALNKAFKVLNDRGYPYARAKQLFAQSGTCIIWFGTTSWGVQSYVNPCTTFNVWFNGENGVTAQTVIVGMFANVVFGFIDNAGLFFGGCYLDEVFALLPGSEDANVGAGYGNTFSDGLGAFLGTFVGLMLSDATGISEGPLWANCLGIIIGCLLGIAIPKLIVGNSSTVGLNKLSARQVLLGSMEIDELEAIIDGQKTLFQFRCERTFARLDTDGSGALDIDEIRNYMIDAMGDDFNEEQFQIDLKEVFQVHKGSDDQEVDFNEFKLIYRNMAIETLKHRKKEDVEKQQLNDKKSYKDIEAANPGSTTQKNKESSKQRIDDNDENTDNILQKQQNINNNETDQLNNNNNDQISQSSQKKQPKTIEPMNIKVGGNAE